MKTFIKKLSPFSLRLYKFPKFLNSDKFYDVNKSEKYKKNSDEMIEELLQHKGKPDYNSSNSNYNNKLSDNKKRTKVSFLRDGMIFSLSIRRVVLFNKGTQMASPNSKSDGYVYIDLKEYTENFKEDNKIRDQRFLVVNGIALAKWLLLQPQLYNPNNLQKISFYQKMKSLEIEQKEDNKYQVTLRVNQQDENEQETNPLISQTELNAEDIIIIQKFVDKSIDDLLNL